MKVLLPTPGTPETAIRVELPVWGRTVSRSLRPFRYSLGRVLSNWVMSCAIALRFPARTASFDSCCSGVSMVKSCFFRFNDQSTQVPSEQHQEYGFPVQKHRPLQDFRGIHNQKGESHLLQPRRCLRNSEVEDIPSDP